MTATPTQRALIVEDDPDIGQLLVHYLQKAGFDTDSEDSIRDALRKVAGDRGHYAAIWELAEALLQHDELAAAWRARRAATARAS